MATLTDNPFNGPYRETSFAKVAILLGLKVDVGNDAPGDGEKRVEEL